MTAMLPPKTDAPVARRRNDMEELESVIEAEQERLCIIEESEKTLTEDELNEIKNRDTRFDYLHEPL